MSEEPKDDIQGSEELPDLIMPSMQVKRKTAPVWRDPFLILSIIVILIGAIAALILLTGRTRSLSMTETFCLVDDQPIDWTMPGYSLDVGEIHALPGMDLRTNESGHLYIANHSMEGREATFTFTGAGAKELSVQTNLRFVREPVKPELRLSPQHQAIEGKPWHEKIEVSHQFRHPLQKVVRARLLEGPEGIELKISDSVVHINWVPGEKYHGDNKIVVEILDGVFRLPITLQVHVTPVNDPPRFTTKPASNIVYHGQTWTYSPGAVDDSHEEVIFSVKKLPVGMTWNASENLLSYTPTPSLPDVVEVVIGASDGQRQAFQTIELVAGSLDRQGLLNDQLDFVIPLPDNLWAGITRSRVVLFDESGTVIDNVIQPARFRRRLFYTDGCLLAPGPDFIRVYSISESKRLVPGGDISTPRGLSQVLQLTDKTILVSGRRGLESYSINELPYPKIKGAISTKGRAVNAFVATSDFIYIGAGAELQVYALQDLNKTHTSWTLPSNKPIDWLYVNSPYVYIGQDGVIYALEELQAGKPILRKQRELASGPGFVVPMVNGFAVAGKRVHLVDTTYPLQPSLEALETLGTDQVMSPIGIGKLENLPESLSHPMSTVSLAAIGDVLWAGGLDTIQQFSLADPRLPEMVSSKETSCHATNLIAGSSWVLSPCDVISLNQMSDANIPLPPAPPKQSDLSAASDDWLAIAQPSEILLYTAQDGNWNREASLQISSLIGGMALSGNRLVISDTTGSSIQSYELTSSAQPSLKSTLNLEVADGEMLLDIEADGPLVMLCLQKAGLRLITYESPEQPQVPLSFKPQAELIDIDVFHGFAAWMDRFGGIGLLDIREPANPIIVDVFNHGGLPPTTLDQQKRIAANLVMHPSGYIFGAQETGGISVTYSAYLKHAFRRLAD